MKLKQAAFLRELKHSVCRRNIDSMFLYYTSPILRAVKPAVLISIDKKCLPAWRTRKNAMCRSTGLCMKEIVRNNGTILYFIYDKNALHEALTDEAACEVLHKFGYRPDSGIEKTLSLLAGRFTKDDFPHEIGFFLGYPPGDVKGFIENNGKNSTCCRYWKVYDDVDAAKTIWSKIEEAHLLAMEVLQNNPPMHVAANKLKLCA